MIVNNSSFWGAIIQINNRNMEEQETGIADVEYGKFVLHAIHRIDPLTSMSMWKCMTAITVGSHISFIGAKKYGEFIKVDWNRGSFSICNPFEDCTEEEIDMGRNGGNKMQEETLIRLSWPIRHRSNERFLACKNFHHQMFHEKVFAHLSSAGLELGSRLSCIRTSWEKRIIVTVSLWFHPFDFASIFATHLLQPRKSSLQSSSWWR